MKRINFSRLSTEQPNPRSRGLDKMTSRQIVRLMNREDTRVLQAINRAVNPIARGADLIAASFRKGGRLILVGAGTSGRLAVMEAAECPPTFNSDQVKALMAGGKRAVFKSQEGAEDSESEARKAVRQAVRFGDVVLGIAASGVTPYVRAALQEARRRGARTILLTCNAKTNLPSAQLRIALNVGPEILTGSTRLKSGTACKMVLNMLTTAAMVQSGKVYDHWMVDLQPKSRKLVARGMRLIQKLGGVSEEHAGKLFQQARGRVKPAILMARKNIYYTQALKQLSEANGVLRKAITQWH
jgi:N-acetylmuramic acid 6-phosphate etherase